MKTARRMCAQCKTRPARNGRSWLCRVCNPSASKYGNRVVRDPIAGKFDSTGERRRWTDLRNMETAGAIRDLQRQVRHPMIVAGLLITTYVTDFEYVALEVPGRTRGERVVEDFKGKETEAFRIKAKLLRALEGLQVTRVKVQDLAR